MSNIYKIKIPIDNIEKIFGKGGSEDLNESELKKIKKILISLLEKIKLNDEYLYINFNRFPSKSLSFDKLFLEFLEFPGFAYFRKNFNLEKMLIGRRYKINLKNKNKFNSFVKKIIEGIDNYNHSFPITKIDQIKLISRELKSISILYLKNISLTVENFDKEEFNNNNFKDKFKGQTDEEGLQINDLSLEDINLPKFQNNDLKIGLFDTTISYKNKNELIKKYKNWLKIDEEYEENLKILDRDYNNISHGESMAFLLINGLNVNSWTDKSIDGIKNNFEVTLIPIISRDEKNKETLEKIKKRIEYGIKKYHNEIKVWILSINQITEINPKESLTSEFAKFLDKLQIIYDIKIIISSGNADEYVNQNKNYLLPPSDSFFSLTVNSINLDNTKTNYSKKGWKNLFGYKPDLSLFGGGDYEDQKVIVYSAGEFFKKSGTSISAVNLARNFEYILKKIWKTNFYNLNSLNKKELIKKTEILIINNSMINNNFNNKNFELYGNGIWSKANFDHINNNNKYFSIYFFEKIDSRHFKVKKIPLPNNSNNFKIYITIISNSSLNFERGLEKVESNVIGSFQYFNSSNEKLQSISSGKEIIGKIDIKNGEFMRYEKNLVNDFGKYQRINSFIIDLRKTRYNISEFIINFTRNYREHFDDSKEIEFYSYITVEDLSENLNSKEYYNKFINNKFELKLEIETKNLELNLEQELDN
ncbi:Peptidases S8 Subtilisin-like protein [Candidatus Hepatoplasma crinochetorum Av]|uniref:Peptidases S8 Subtilisin-like protein n=2 Tax=Candidatus Hepatoplasma crinochetorum TaxID=295596 RepID=W8GMJ5_9MOLU|nr:Peptidases S8 Subtilisin-like protein [Candidatus Hepatoplasma crinochetorum Av]